MSRNKRKWANRGIWVKRAVRDDGGKRVNRNGANRRSRRGSARRRSFWGAKPARRRERRRKRPRRRSRSRSKLGKRRPSEAFSSPSQGAKRSQPSPPTSPTTAKKRKNRANTSCRPSKRIRADRREKVKSNSFLKVDIVLFRVVPKTEEPRQGRPRRGRLTRVLSETVFAKALKLPKAPGLTRRDGAQSGRNRRFCQYILIDVY